MAHSMKKLILVRGLPGSGKSTIGQEYKKKHSDSCFICATDEYWFRPDGIYDFNIELIGESHRWNQHRVEEILDEEVDSEWDTIVVVDNTNITFQEMKPYIKMALVVGFEIEFMEPSTSWRYDVEECFKRNGHGVPYATILRMSQCWEDHATVLKKLEELKCGS